jgi:putative RecB family exonuclease
MALPLPSSLSPSKVSSFTDCALAFRLSAIDRVPQPPSPAATRGTLVHRALELLFCGPPSQRTLPAALACLSQAHAELSSHPDLVDLGLDSDEEGELVTGAQALLTRYFELEDPRAIHPIGLELLLTAQIGNLTVRGIIDRLELDADGRLVVTDYKTGVAPHPTFEQRRLGGVHFYAFLCEQVLGQMPVRVQLLHLADPVAIVARPTERSVRALQRRTEAVWKAIERACAAEDFRPHPSPLCQWCAYQAYCPAFGGDPELARAATLVATG